MAIIRSMHVLAVPNLARSSDFYARVLGFEIREMGDPGWRLFVKDECRIMAGECPDAPPAAALGDHSYYAYLVVDDANEYFERVRQSEAELIKPLRDERWGMREFGLRTIAPSTATASWSGSSSALGELGRALWARRHHAPFD